MQTSSKYVFKNFVKFENTFFQNIYFIKKRSVYVFSTNYFILLCHVVVANM